MKLWEASRTGAKPSAHCSDLYYSSLKAHVVVWRIARRYISSARLAYPIIGFPGSDDESITSKHTLLCEDAIVQIAIVRRKTEKDG